MLAPETAALKRVVLRDDVVGQDAAVAPAADAEPIGVGDSRPDDVVDGRHHVLVVLVPPVGPDRAAVRGSPARRAARVRGDDGVAVRGEHLPLELERGRVLVGGPAVDPQDRGDALPRRRPGRQGQEGVHDGAVATRGRDLLDVAEGDRLQEVVVGVGQPAEGAPGDGGDLRRLMDRRLEHHDLAARGHVEGLHVALALRRCARRSRLRPAPGRGAGCRGPPGGRAPRVRRA